MNELTQQEQWQVDSLRDNISSLGGLLDEMNSEKERSELLQEAIIELLPQDVDELLVLIDKMGLRGKVNYYLEPYRDAIVEMFIQEL